ncbi:DUF2460 domain-containing protein [Alteraurantiacibacter aquimixticola]|uniref:TIGR02217 family protein n=1 Tax=Alteraurantiacibacter aquimixticola TaxID=2489173 RepID=A0A4T3F0E5_9SPHN|nr:DUF2460 domain-containing protein [Alteraurantiacibacter aquimixticola]TIX49377.1 TIGR02217 family protein [Alteraurantiacibacter aquimixticola]
MAFWLARSRDGQQTDFIQRFDPRFWTVDFPRPMMASVVTTGPDSLRMDFEFHHRDALAGLIWWSEDTLDHPLLAYDTDRDYSRTTLSFRWRSGGVLPLDAVNGPTLTIEGRDAAGNARTWYVRMWNYATGSPQDAQIVLPFSDLFGGWDIGSSTDQVYPNDIDRMFISLAPPLYDSTDESLLPARVDGWVEMSEINCDGDRALLEIGDVMVPPHGVRMATAYDDSYNQTPERLLRNLRGLGYRDEILHYVGMSHYYRVVPGPGDTMVADDPAVLAEPALAWHRDMLAKAKAQGYDFILSFSFELLAQNCPKDWTQRAHDASPALTGWDPPSSLLALGNSEAVTHLRQLALKLAQLQAAAGLPVKIQIGEPWWWVKGSYAPCIYDAATAALFDPAVPRITDMRQTLSSAQIGVLNTARDLMGSVTRSIKQDIKNAHGSTAEVLLLAFTPTLLDPQMPAMTELNIPLEWQHPEFDRLQLEDYDWLTGGAEALRRQGYQTMDALLQYPLDQQDYMSGFVLNAEDADAFWPLIDAGLEEAKERGVPRLYVWALPQVCRDGYTRLPDSPPDIGEYEDDDMQAFDDVLYPLALGRDAGVSPEFSTSIVLTASGHERRNSLWSDARLRYDVGPGIRSESELGVLLEFFRARRGAARGFRLADPFDFSSNGLTGSPSMFDQRIGVGDGLAGVFQLTKSYGEGAEPQVRPISRPRPGTITISVDGAPETGWTLEPGGKIVFTHAPPAGAVIRAGFLFDVPVRFAEDRLDITGAAFAAGEAPSVPLVEIREEL